MILIVDMNWKKNSLGCYEFVLPIITVAEKLDDRVIKHYSDVTTEDLNQCDKIILAGTALKDTATLIHPEKFQWLKKTEKPVLGICAGMQTIGIVFDATLVMSLEIGMTQITTIKENTLFSGDFRAYSLHSYCVDHLDNFEVWAKSKKCIQAIKHKHKEIYGVLFHPEVRNKEILQHFIAAKA
jgi:GMP synthase-like glutamine amidotransferase